MREAEGLKAMPMFATKEALIPYLLLVAALAGGLLWHESETVPGLGRTVITGRSLSAGRSADRPGRQAACSADFRGRYMLIYFGYSFCPDVCPTTLGVMARGAGQAGRRRGPHRAHLHHHRSGARHAGKVLASIIWRRSGRALSA